MARVSGMKEKLHMPLYDSFFVRGIKNGRAAEKFTDAMNDPRVLRFFVDVQDKTRLETNLQAAGVLPSLNSYEARAMRIVVSPTHVALEESKIQEIADTYCGESRSAGTDDKKLKDAKNLLFAQINEACNNACIAAGSILPELIYSSVTTLYVGEKVMIEMPTFWFPAGAGVTAGNGSISNHGEPDPMATFRFAEPVGIESQQNFRVEMSFPQGVPESVGNVFGPLRIWAILDGYLTRDVQ
jgi:hypothetical protein